MGKFFIRIAAYFFVFVLLNQFFTGMSGSLSALLLLAVVLALANGTLRPILTLMALPLNIITFGIASVFVNMLTLLIADALVMATVIHGFWLMALVSVAILIADSMIRKARYSSF